MSALTLVLATGVAVLIVVLVWSAARARLRRTQFSEPFPPEWRSMLERDVRLYRRMPPELRLKLEPITRAFLTDVQFIGRQGLEVTQDMRLIVAVQACLLVAERDVHTYTSLSTVLLYPDEFVVNEKNEDEAGVVTEGESVLSGQSLDTSQIVLSWRDVQESITGTIGEPYNVVLHEFAHYLDNMVGGTLTDTGSSHEAFEAWHEVLDREYQSLCDAVDRGDATLIDPYGGESTVEFFAVATETFFDEPREMQRLHPALYAELASFYGLDPASWSDPDA